MARPRKWRRVCCLPDNQNFGPLDSKANKHNVILMTVDEYEAIRLIDLEGLNQEQCSERMGVARTTAQTIYSSARVKLAKCLVNGTMLSISGGDYVLCDGGNTSFGCGHCHKKRGL
ncbi:MAG: DUF134 domain-containing protein [Oscillospiraceae bacterium]|jgi:predicted DNA-binding protein (UPF0251 family)